MVVLARTNVNLPALGEGVSAGTLARWLVGTGERVQRYQALVEVETDKVSAELPSPVAGVLVEILVPEGASVAPGTAICVVEDEPAAAPHADAPAALPATGCGIDADRPAGSGAHGRAAQEDVPRQEARGGAPADAPPTRAARPEGAMRRRIAERLTRSWREAPHAWMLVECDVTGLAALRASVRSAFRDREGQELTYLPFFVRAVVAGLRAEPALNATWREGGVVAQERIALGIAVALEEGLVVPVLGGADDLSVAGLARVLHGLVARARNGRLLTAELEGGTFTVNNTGAFGSVASAPIINPPQAGIVTFEAIMPRPVVVGEGIAIRQRQNVCLSFDHRVADGLAAARFLQAVRGVLEAYRPGDPIY